MRMNEDLVAERKNATLNVDALKSYLGELIHYTPENYRLMLKYRPLLVQQIKPINEENFYNLEREQKYDIIYKKSLEMVEFVKEINVNEEVMSLPMIGSVLGLEKFLFNLHFTMFRDSINVWGSPEQREYWNSFMDENVVLGTYVQTELGHGTYLRGLETTATYDKRTQEFIIDSPTLTSIKFWPGTSGKACNFAIVMAKLMIDGNDHGIHAFVVQLRSLDNHRVVPGLEVGDIGKKFGFDATDNGYLKFNKLRIPRTNMLMQFARVTSDGKFERLGNELLMYAAMLLMRGTLSLVGSFYLSMSTTIAIRYSCVRRQTPNSEGVEQQVINYQTQQYRLFPGLAASYAFSFTGWTFRKILLDIKKEANDFKNVKPNDLAKLHAISSGLKALVFGDCLKFAQSNRLCCGGHGYSASSGLTQIIQEADAGCTYEGDNIVLYLQTARYLLKCAQKGVSPHLELPTMNEIKSSSLYHHFKEYIQLFEQLYEESMNEITSKLFKLVKEEGVPELNAWNQTSQQLISVARVFSDMFIINSNIASIYIHKCVKNQQILAELCELYILYAICDTYAANILRFNLIDPEKMSEFREKLYNLLPKIRINAVSLTDSFDYLDSNLCSTLGAYDGRAYERLFEFAQNSLFNEKEVHDAFQKYLKPYSLRLKQKAKL